MSALLTLIMTAGFAGAADIPKQYSGQDTYHVLKVQNDGGSLPGVPGGKAGKSGAEGGAGGAGGNAVPGQGAPQPVTEEMVVKAFGTNEALIRQRLGEVDEDLGDLTQERALLRRQLRRATGAPDCDITPQTGDGASLPGVPGGKAGKSGDLKSCSDNADFAAAKTSAGKKLDGSDGASISGGVGGQGGKSGAGVNGGSGGSGGAGVSGGKGGKGGAGGASD